MDINYFQVVMQTLGGIGLFLLGMVIMTNSLHQMAGAYVRSILMRFTRTPLSGAVTGAVSTAILQSSSATTVAAVGFVGAGLLSFSEALGIVFGANIGTTLKGWMIVLIGFKYSLTELMLPIIFLGVLMNLFSRRLQNLGLSIAGFGLVFIGIVFLQQAMSGLQGVVTPDVFPDDTWIGRIQLFFMGVLITLITQSSSAGVAAALTALFAGAINFEQAASMVIGMDVGTTATAALATIGGNVGSRRTGLSHVIYNVMTGVGAMLFLSPFIYLWERVAPGTLHNNAEMALVAFHTSFNVLGVVLVLPVAHQFARLVERLIPEHALSYTASLDTKLLVDSSVSLTAVSSVVQHEARDLFAHLLHLVSKSDAGRFCNLDDVRQGLDETRRFVEQIKLSDGHDADRERVVAIIHIIDHLARLHERCDEDVVRAEAAVELPSLEEALRELGMLLEQLLEEGMSHPGQYLEQVAQISEYFDQQEHQWRSEFMHQVADGAISVPEGTRRLEAVRWLRRVTYHISRIMHYIDTVSFKP